MRARDTAALVQIFQRGYRLWKSNPRLFSNRMGSYLRSPRWGLHELIETPRRSRRIQESYEGWINCRRSQTLDGARSDDGPLLSVILPVFNTPGVVLRAAIESVIAQTYWNWELCVGDDASWEPHVHAILAEFVSRDPRIRVVRRAERGHISAASNSAVAAARGDFIVLLDHDDVLAPQALLAVATVIRQDPLVDFIYSDEDKLDPDGTRVEPFFKPAWSPTLLAGGNYITHLAVLRRATVLAAGGFRDEMVGSQDHDLFLRVSERARHIAHIPEILYSWRKSPVSTAVATGAKPYAVQASHRAVQDAVRRRGADTTLEPSHLNGLFVTRPHLRTPVRLSLVVRGSPDAWIAHLRSRNFDVCDTTSIVGEATAESVSRTIDGGQGDLLLFLDAEERSATSESVARLLAVAQRAEIGVAGGITSVIGREEILQAGIAFASNGQPFYAFAGASSFPQRNFYLNLKDLSREVSAVYAGCGAVRRTVWEAVGGWSDAVPTGLALYDLCLRVLAAGYANVYTPSARFETTRHLPSIPPVTACPWDWLNFDDPFWNPNLSPFSPDGLPFRCDGTREPAIRPGPGLTAHKQELGNR